ncbi:MAG: restriction endonuclease subunit S [Aestuariivita sp.]|nr:restriction endonuclease subunit S [Aestuariivita sp.]
MNWGNEKLGKLCDKIGSGITPRGGASVYIDRGVGLIRSQNVYNSRFSTNGLVCITDKVANRMSNVTVKADDILLNITGDSVARSCKVPVAILPARVNQHVAIIRTIPVKLSPSFLGHFLVSPKMQNIMLSLAGSGGTRKALTKGMIENFDIPLPDLPTQERIAGVLSAYDDLIDNNRRRIALLEEAARLIYREWFVHFRFPGHENTPFENGLPVGWERYELPEIVDFKEGPGLRNHQYRDKGVPFLNIRTLVGDDIDLSKIQFLEPDEVSRRYEHFLLKEDDHVVSSSGTLGRLATVRESHLPLCLNTSIIRYRPKKIIGKWFLKAFLLHGDFIDQAKSMATGAAQLNYGPSHVKQMRVLVGSKTIMQSFEDLTAPVYTQKKQLFEQNAVLARTRDLLLPRLMDGRITV